jgi:large subunit ribosomal protein L9
MRVVLREDVETLGNKGDIVEVRDGYARNYLVPRGLAITANRGVIKQAEAMRRNRDIRDRREREAAQELATQLVGRALTITARVGEGGKLFGSVGAADVAEAISTQIGQTIDRRAIQLGDPWKEVGTYEVPVKLHTDVIPVITVNIVG